VICFGTLVNVLGILAGGTAGLVLKKILSARVTDTVMQGVGLAVVFIGISGALSASLAVADGRVLAEHVMLMIVSLALGGLAGELIGIEKRLDAFAQFCVRKFAKAKPPKLAEGAELSAESPKLAEAAGLAERAEPRDTSMFAQGFVTASLVFCVGSMAIVGALEEGIHENNRILLAKTALDTITAMIFASTMGAGVLFSALAVGLYQGGLTLLSTFVAPYLGDEIVAQISLIGSVLIMGIGFNLLRIAKIKVGNLLPAVFVPVAYAFVLSL